MPRKFKRKRRFRKRRTRKGKRGSRNTLVNRALNPFAAKYICRLKYTQHFTAIGSSFTAQRFRLNSIYDPDFSGGGHQPYCHDQYAVLYNRYRVLRTSWAITSASAGGYNILAAIPTNGVDTISSMDHALELPRCRYLSQAPGAPLKTLRGKMGISKLMGLTQAQYRANEGCESTFGANPTDLALLAVYMSNTNRSDHPDSDLTITLVYTVEMFDPKNFEQS